LGNGERFKTRRRSWEKGRYTTLTSSRSQRLPKRKNLGGVRFAQAARGRIKSRRAEEGGGGRFWTARGKLREKNLSVKNSTDLPEATSVNVKRVEPRHGYGKNVEREGEHNGVSSAELEKLALRGGVPPSGTLHKTNTEREPVSAGKAEPVREGKKYGIGRKRYNRGRTCLGKDEEVSLTREEGKKGPTNWAFKVMCPAQEERATQRGPYAKTRQYSRCRGEPYARQLKTERKLGLHPASFILFPRTGD